MGILITLILSALICCGSAASYTLPEKMYNQFIIGSGLKGEFTVYADGEAFQSRFLKEISNADFSLRAIMSGKDLHGYVYQGDDNVQQSALSELYCKDGIYYFRSDLVPGKILSFSTFEEYVDSLLPVQDENVSPVSFLLKWIISSVGSQNNETANQNLLKFENELEMWLANFSVQADTARMENGLSALDFSYEIPMDEVFRQIITLYTEILSDPAMNTLVESELTPEQAALYADRNLIYYYEEALNALNIHSPLRMSKRISAMGEVLRFKLEMPLDRRSTGFDLFSIETVEDHTFYLLRNDTTLLLFGRPTALESGDTASSEQTFWLIKYDPDHFFREDLPDLAVRINVQKENQTYNDDEDKSHEVNHYTLSVRQDTSYLPADFDAPDLVDFQELTAEFNLHYSSKYAQNSATSLEIDGNILQGNSSLKIQAKLKTAAPWLFMPFTIADPISVGNDPNAVFRPYMDEWTGSASSLLIHHVSSEISQKVEAESTPEITESEEPSADASDPDAEAVPLDLTEAE